jgi:hypothetical protein
MTNLKNTLPGMFWMYLYALGAINSRLFVISDEIKNKNKTGHEVAYQIRNNFTLT